MEGLIIKNTGNRYIARTTDGEQVTCNIKGNFRIKGIRTTNPVAVGDIVTLTPIAGDESYYITEIKPRRNYIIRRASNLSKESHILAANIDQALLIATLAHPVTSTTFIDRFLATAEAYRVPAILVINKIDLLEDYDAELLDAVTYLYSSIGYKVIAVSARTGQGINQLRSVLDRKTTLLSGNSGVGKTTIINALIPGLDLKTANISDIHDTGMHTTTFSEMFELPAPLTGAIIDTPGVRGFGTIEMERNEVAHFFPEIFKVSADCKFNNCTHTHEPGCAVLAALDDNLIAQSRYQSYLSILDDTNPDKYRKPY